MFPTGLDSSAARPQATVSFLALNGRDVVLLDDEAFDLVMAVAGGRLDVPEIAAVLAEHTALR